MLAVALLLLTRWAVVVPVAVVERTGVGTAFRESRVLVRGQSRRVLATIVLVWFPLTALTFLVRLLATGADARMLLNTALTVVTLPVYALTPAVLYFALLDAAPALDPGPGDATTRPPLPSGL